MGSKIEILIEEHNSCKGMLDELIMKCLLLKDKLSRSKKTNKKFASSKLIEEVSIKLNKYNADLNKYTKRMRFINMELKEIYGTNEF